MHPFQDPILFFYVHLSLWADRLRQKTGQVLIALLSLCVAQTASADEDIAGMVNHITHGIASV